MLQNNLKCKKKSNRKCKIKIRYLDSHSIKTHFQLRKLRLRSSEKKNAKCINFKETVRKYCVSNFQPTWSDALSTGRWESQSRMVLLISLSFIFEFSHLL